MVKAKKSGPSATPVLPLREEDAITKKRSSSTSLLAKFGILFGSLLLSFLMLEVAFRLLGSRISPARWDDRPSEWYLPEHSEDHRNAPFSVKKAEGTFRVVVVGDSFTFAGKVHYDDNFAKRLERMLQLNATHRKVEVLNWGIPGYSTKQEVALVKKATGDFNADLVILEITLNDPELEPYHSSHSGTYRWARELEKGFLFTHWRSLQFFAQRILNTLRNEEYLRYHQELFEREDSWMNFNNALEKIAHLSRDSHAPVVALVFPMLSHPFDSSYPFRTAHEKIDARLKEIGLPAIDLLPALHGIPPERLQAKPGEDAHPNEIAHRIAADALYAFLKAQALLPPDTQFKESRQRGRKLSKDIKLGKSFGQIE